MFWAKRQLVSCFESLILHWANLFKVCSTLISLPNWLFSINFWSSNSESFAVTFVRALNNAIAWTSSSKMAFDLMYQLKTKMWLLVIILDDPFENFQFSLCERKSDLDYTFRLICQEKTDLADQDRFGSDDLQILRQPDTGFGNNCSNIHPI